MVRLILAVAFFAALVGLYIVLFLMNRRTPKPEGCENLKPDCSACKDYSCPNHSKKES